LTLKEQIQSLPDSPGVYHYYDKRGRLLYIGKAKSLIKRVKSYWRFTPDLGPNPTLGSRILRMVSEAASMQYIVVESEHDALILENSLIKQLKPKYNILLRDDKTYPYIYIDTNEPFARFEITRKVIKGRSIRYFGPYSVAARDILDSVYELCKLVQKKSCLRGGKACLYYQLEQCLAPCEKKIPQEKYDRIIEEAVSYIQNKPKLLRRLGERMHTLAEAMRFEEAAALRDRIERIEKSQLQSQIDLANKDSYDIFAIAHKNNRAVTVRMFMRKGKIVSSAHAFSTLNEGFDVDEAYERALLDFYGTQKPPIIAPILIADPFATMLLVQEHLSTLFEKKAQILSPQRGNKKKLIELARSNAQMLLEQSTHQDKEPLIQSLKELCSLERLPERIEVFDNSHIGGEATVGAMVVFDNGSFDKSGYRLYHLEARDEYAQMREMLTRRIESFEQNPPPDLWVIDGGATLLSLATDLLASAGVNLDAIAISKEKVDAKAHRAKGKAHDQLHSQEGMIKLMPTDKRLQFVQKLRDEAHRSAIAFHKKTKVKRDQESKALNAKGISMAKIRKLLNHFGTFEQIAQADFEEIASVLNTKDAQVIKETYT